MLMIAGEAALSFVHVAQSNGSGGQSSDSETCLEPAGDRQGLSASDAPSEVGWSTTPQSLVNTTSPSPSTVGAAASLRRHSSSSIGWLSAGNDPADASPDRVHDGTSVLNYSATRASGLPARAPSGKRDTVGWLYRDPPIWPLEDEEDATLLQHFISQVALLFDFCDKDRHFATVVPQRARTCSTLLSAVLSVAARHLSLIGDIEPAVADRHYDRCLQGLIPALNDKDAVLDETLLIIVVILRLLEEFNVPIVGSDNQGHLVGAQSLIRLQGQVEVASSLHQAAYWACLRQEIYMSLRDRRGIRLDLAPFRTFQVVQPGGRYSLSSAATIHCAETIAHTQGYDFPQRLPTYEELAAENKRIRTHEDGQPFYYRARGSDFPDQRYETEDQIIATQYSTLARILLELHPASPPQMGHARRLATRRTKENVRQHVWTMCGVGISNTTSPAALLIACMGTTLAVDCFDTQGDLQRLGSFLDLTERTRGWPTASIGILLRHRQDEIKDG